jgi:carbon monoxide dehydrogenase subunit G
MAVRIEGERHIDAPRAAVFAALTDPSVVAQTIPFVERCDARGPNKWQLTVKAPLPLVPAIPLDFEIVEQRAPEHARLHAEGRKLGSGAEVDSSFHLTEQSGGTLVRFRAELRFYGALAPLERMLEPVAERQAQKTLAAIEGRVEKSA